MANPTSRHTRSRRNKRRANWKGSNPTLSVCPSCNEMKAAHHVCVSCGVYDKKKVIAVNTK